MSDEETITVADVSAGPGGTEEIDAGTPVDLPVVDILTGRGFVTGKSGSGKSNTVSVILENLLDNNFPVLIVDSDGEYYGLKEEYEILHVGADDECDIQVTAEHAEKIASLALEENIPIILDVSGYLDEADANELILETTRHLFAKEKKLKKPFLVVIEECHEYIPEQSGMGEAGKMLIKIGKRGRKHGLGIVGISQRPADVKKDFITQCDWLVWHRLTWRNDTKVVGRILGSEYADAVEELADGEGFMVADWADAIQRVQFHRKRTFDAGATPGLEDFERPELKSVSGDLVTELTDISDQKAKQESEIADLRQELDKKEATIRQLEAELREARDLSQMADQFAQALLQRSEAPYRGGEGRNTNRPSEQADLEAYEPDRPRQQDRPQQQNQDPNQAQQTDTETATAATDPAFDPLIAEAEPNRESTDESDSPSPTESTPASEATSEPPTDSASSFGFESPFESSTGSLTTGTDPIDPSPVDPSEVTGPTDAERAAPAEQSSGEFGTVTRRDIAEEAMQFAEAIELGTRDAVVEELRERIEELPQLSVEMLKHYRQKGDSDPLAAHLAAGGDDNHQLAYSRNRPLRQAQLIRHLGRGTYAYAVPELIREAYAHQLDDDEVDSMVQSVEAGFRESVVDPRETSETAGSGFQFEFENE
jgi:hypothetical protein